VSVVYVEFVLATELPCLVGLVLVKGVAGVAEISSIKVKTEFINSIVTKANPNRPMLLALRAKIQAIRFIRPLHVLLAVALPHQVHQLEVRPQFYEEGLVVGERLPGVDPVRAGEGCEDTLFYLRSLLRELHREVLDHQQQAPPGS